MVVDEQARTGLHAALEQTLGADHANTMMTLLPPVGWADVATKRDLDHLATTIRLELRTEIGELRTEMGELRSDLRGEIAELRDELHTGLAEVRDELHTGLADVRAELHREIGQATRTMVFSMTGALATMGALSFAAASLV